MLHFAVEVLVEGCPKRNYSMAANTMRIMPLNDGLGNAFYIPSSLWNEPVGNNHKRIGELTELEHAHVL